MESSISQTENSSSSSRTSSAAYRVVRIEKHRFAPEVVEQIKQLQKLDNSFGVLAVLEDFIIIGLAICAGILSFQNWLAFIVYPISILLIGSRQRALAELLHSASHRALAKNRTLNFILGTFGSGYLVFQTFFRYRDTHIKGHHHHLGDIEKDPDLRYYVGQGIFELKTKQAFLWKYLIPNFLLLKLPQNVMYLLKERLWMPNILKASKEYKIDYVRFLTYWLVILAIMVSQSWLHWFILFWLVPYFTSFQALNSLIEISEHYPLIAQHNKSIYTSRNRNGSWLENFLTGTHHENFHLIHHLFPAVPFCYFKRAHQILLQDEEYAVFDSVSGGIFTPSRVGNQTIIESMFNPIFKEPGIPSKN